MGVVCVCVCQIFAIDFKSLVSQNNAWVTLSNAGHHYIYIYIYIYSGG